MILGPGGNLYGTTLYGGKNLCPGSGIGCGVVFRLTRGTSGKWRETILHAFDNKDGFTPLGSLVLDKAGNLYGTTVCGGNLNGCTGLGCGVIFRLKPGVGGKWTEKVLHAFNFTDGSWPFGGLIVDSAGNLYGTTWTGGNSSACTGGCGLVFKLTKGAGDKWTETVLYSFQGTDGEAPLAPLTFDLTGNLYGTTENGGAYGWGTVFRLTPGTGGKWTETVLHSFNQTDGQQPGYGVVLDTSGNLYGTTPFGGTYSWGTAFELTRTAGGGWAETVLHAFDRTMVGGGYVSSGLVFDKKGNLYGTTNEGGKYHCPGYGGVGCGVVFRLASRANGKWTETVLHSFGKGADGAGPGGGLAVDSAGRLFGLTSDGGYLGGPCGKQFYTGCGVVFEVAP